jgi:anti-anti-sigma factor
MTGPIHDVRHETIGNVEVVHVRGEIDLSNADSLAAVLRGTTAKLVALELAELAYMDSAGIRAVDRGYRRLHDEGRKLVVVVPPDSPAALIFRVTGISHHLRAGSLPEALALLRDGG